MIEATSGLTAPLLSVKCCICGILDARPIAVGEDFEYRTSLDSFVALQCNRCGLVVLSPRPSVEDLDVIYPSTYHAYEFTPEAFGFVHSVRERLEAHRLLAVCEGLPANARILDVGCGDGFHLRLLKRFGKAGWQLDGVDPSFRAVQQAARSGVAVLHGRLEELNLPASSYDLALMVATVEHVDDPPGLLREVRRVLRPGGRAVIVTDNTATLDFKIWKNRHWGGYHFPRHWNLFNAASLERLASNAHFEVERQDTIVSPVNWVYSIRNWLVDRKAPSFLIRQFSLKTPITLAFFTLVDQVFQWFGRGSLLRLIIRKPAAQDDASV